MNSLNVYIVILNWNGLEDTLECLHSIEKSGYATSTVVIDNASLNGEAEKISEAFPRTVVLPQTENLGFCGGCNVGIEYAMEHGADYVMLLNNDTLITNDLFERLFAGIQSLDHVAAVSPIILEHPNKEKVWYSDARWVTGEAQFRISRPEEGYAELSVRDPFETEFACGCCMLIPVSALREVGLLDERYFAFYDEAGWCAQARKKGLRSYVVPAARMYHKVSRSTPKLVSTYLLTRNRLLWMKENLSVRQRFQSVAYLLRDVIWHLANLVGLTKEHYSVPHSEAVLHGYWDYFRGRFGKWESQIEPLLFQPPSQGERLS